MIKLFNTLTKKKEEFKPLQEIVGLYTCGPTVYNYAHLGNLRTYVFEDILKRVLLYNNYQVKHVMNITDVGHLIGDMDMGEDKMETGAKREGKTARAVADFYTQAFQDDIAQLNILEPDIWCKATDYIPQQINLIEQLEAKGYTYPTKDGVYFDTAKFPNYNKLSHVPLEDLQEGARVEKNDEKRNATDFALWKLSPRGAKRQMEWASPWGKGFPGWHLECSAMSLANLAGQLDIHCGGIDHINIHHTNEIAQSEAATGQKFFNYWLHGAFLNIVGGKKMAKSEDNFLTIGKALVDRNLKPLVFRFACLQVHYRKPMEYSEEILANAANGFEHLTNQILNLGSQQGQVNAEYQKRFVQAINDDLNTPQGLAVAQEVFKSHLNNADKLATILDFDKVLGLRLSETQTIIDLPEPIKELVQKRQTARQTQQWELADTLRQQLEDQGYRLEDGADGLRVIKKGLREYL